MQCSGKQCNVVESNAMRWKAMQCDGKQCNTMESNAMQWNVMQCSGMQCTTVECNATQWNAVEEEYLKRRVHPYHEQCIGTSEIPMSFTIDPYVSGSD